MTALDLDQFKERIQLILRELESLAVSSQEAARPVELDQTRQGRLSRMDAMQSQAMAKVGEARRQVQVNELKKALTRIEQGDFGTCGTCGEDISVARLTADPAVLTCIDCAQALE